MFRSVLRCFDECATRQSSRGEARGRVHDLPDLPDARNQPDAFFVSPAFFASCVGHVGRVVGWSGVGVVVHAEITDGQHQHRQQLQQRDNNNTYNNVIINDIMYNIDDCTSTINNKYQHRYQQQRSPTCWRMRNSACRWTATWTLWRTGTRP